MGAAFVPLAGTGSVWRGASSWFSLCGGQAAAVPALDAGGFLLVAGKGAFGDVATGEHCCFFPLVGKRLRPVQAPGADSRFSSFPEEGEEVGPDAALWRRSGFPL